MHECAEQMIAPLADLEKNSLVTVVVAVVRRQGLGDIGQKVVTRDRAFFSLHHVGPTIATVPHGMHQLVERRMPEIFFYRHIST